MNKLVGGLFMDKYNTAADDPWFRGASEHISLIGMLELILDHILPAVNAASAPEQSDPNRIFLECVA